VTDHDAARAAAAAAAYPDRHGGYDRRREDRATKATPVKVDVPVVDDGRWRDRAACKGMDPSLFFPEQGNRVIEPLAVCARCPVQQPCKEFAIRHGEPGIWGGTSGRDRRIERRNIVSQGVDERRNHRAPFAALVDLLVAIDKEERGAA
jgi:WhiB family transcriptional regulator, redox-sensing transcriptional regulator